MLMTTTMIQITVIQEQGPDTNNYFLSCYRQSWRICAQNRVSPRSVIFSKSFLRLYNCCIFCLTSSQHFIYFYWRVFLIHFTGFSRPLSRQYRATTSVHVNEPQTVDSEGMYQTQYNFIEDNIKKCAIFFHNWGLYHPTKRRQRERQKQR